MKCEGGIKWALLEALFFFEIEALDDVWNDKMKKCGDESAKNSRNQWGGGFSPHVHCHDG
jgi:hypothetical protein